MVRALEIILVDGGNCDEAMRPLTNFLIDRGKSLHRQCILLSEKESKEEPSKKSGGGVPSHHPRITTPSSKVDPVESSRSIQ